MRIFKAFILTTLSFVIATLILPASITHALSSGESLGIFPSKVIEYIKPGSSYSGSVVINNLGSNPYVFSSYSTPYNVIDEDYDPSFIKIPGKPDIAKWFYTSPSGGLLNPNGAATIHYKITVPKTALPGDYYAALFAQTNSIGQTKSKSSLAINERVGTIFYIQVSGPVSQRGSLDSWQSNFLQKPPISARLKLKNNGNVFYISNINIYFQDIFGNTKYTYNAQSIVLSNTTRLINITWPHSPSFGLFKVKGYVTIYGTIQLKTKYILVISPIIRIIIAVIVCLIILSLFLKSKKQDDKHYRF